ncbi:hypothetical protein ABVT39_005254 [Epinephelus coioides]
MYPLWNKFDCANVFCSGFLTHCPAKGLPSQAAEPFLSKTIWVTPSETEKRAPSRLIMGHSAKPKERGEAKMERGISQSSRRIRGGKSRVQPGAELITKAHLKSSNSFDSTTGHEQLDTSEDFSSRDDVILFVDQ